MLRISSWLATSGKFCRAKALAMLWSSVHCIASAIASTPRQLLAVSCFSDRQKTHGQTHTHTHTHMRTHTRTRTHTCTHTHSTEWATGRLQRNGRTPCRCLISSTLCVFAVKGRIRREKWSGGEEKMRGEEWRGGGRGVRGGGE